MQAMESIQAVSFDVGGTLIEPWPSVGHVYAAVAAEHGHAGILPDILNHQFARAWKRKTGFDHSRPAWRTLVQETFANLLQPGQAAALLDDLYQQFARGAAWRMFDDVLPTLRALKTRGFRLAVVSNWDERLRPLLKDLELTPFFDAIVISVEVGAAKPAARIFQHCTAGLNLPPEVILHVGDSRAEDFEGARRAGMPAALIERKPDRDGADRLTRLELLLPRLPARRGFGDKGP
jgi:putative hydrolase of the HAD superfamily